MKFIFSTLLCALTIAVSTAQDKNEQRQDTTTLISKTQLLDEVIVTGNLRTDPIHTVVKNTYAEKIVQPKNVADLFKDINGFSVIKRGNYAIDPSFRASQYEQLNIQYDGGTKAMHACPNRMDPITTHIIPEEIAKIEIVKGPYTVRYGATFGGIVNLVTQKPDSEARGLHGKVSGGYESNGSSFVSMVQLQQITDKYDIVGNVGYRDFGDYVDGDDDEIPSSFRSTDYGLKAGYNLSERQRLQAHWRQSFGRDVLHAGLPMDTEYDNSSILSLDYKITDLGETVQSLTAKAYYSFVDHLMTNENRPSSMLVDAKSAVETTTMGGKIELKWKLAPRVTLYTGLDAFNVASDGSRTRIVKLNMMGVPLEVPITFIDKVWQDSYTNDYGVFTEAKWSLTDKTILTLGARYDYIVSDIQDPEEDFATLYDLEKRTENNYSGTVSVKQLVTDNFTLEAAWGRGVRSASLLERYINHFTVGQDAYEYVGNPNLKAEVNNQFEIGFTGKEPLENGLNKLTYQATGYFSYYQNYITAVVDENIFRKFMPMNEPRNAKVFQNIDKAYKTGIEASLRLDFLEDYFINSELAYVYAKNQDFNESLPLTPPLTTVFSAGIEKEKYWANVQYNITSSQENIAENFGETRTAGYETMDLKIGVKPFKGITIGGAVINVFDETYNNHLNFSFNNQADFGSVPINEPGRNFSAFAQYTF